MTVKGPSLVEEEAFTLRRSTYRKIRGDATALDLPLCFISITSSVLEWRRSWIFASAVCHNIGFLSNRRFSRTLPQSAEKELPHWRARLPRTTHLAVCPVLLALQDRPALR